MMYGENEIKFITDKVRADERERIIKLLEDNLYYAGYEGIFRKTGGLGLDVADIIALIKGETEWDK